MIEVRNVSKEFNGFHALSNLSMTIPKGSVYGLVGPNGAGKSTIIRHLTGIYQPDKGEIFLNGKPIFENPDAKSRIAYIPDDIFFFPNATVKETVDFYRSIYPSFDKERFKKLGELFNIDTKQQMRRLSKGMQKQAAFWIAISLRPEVLILDEPVDGLDPVMRRQIWSIILADVAENGTTVLVSSHNLRELEDVCDHVGIMNRGRILIERSLSELQGDVIKVQLALPDGAELPEGLNILHQSNVGRLKTLIIRGKSQDISECLKTASPFFVDMLPLTLEEIFIYELGGADYEVKDIIL
ncbi:MAG: ABC transporter ATP-binding protein [Bacillota bacterium]|nr:ABC transporter ATP-binding protein [Bacillota bacterium]